MSSENELRKVASVEIFFDTLVYFLTVSPRGDKAGKNCNSLCNIALLLDLEAAHVLEKTLELIWYISCISFPQS